MKKMTRLQQWIIEPPITDGKARDEKDSVQLV
jgi:hypothetical protein